MKTKNTVYFMFLAGSEGALRMTELKKNIENVEQEAEKLAKEMGLTAYYPDVNHEFGGIGLMEPAPKKLKKKIYNKVDSVGGRGLYLLNVESQDRVINDKDVSAYQDRSDVLISTQLYGWLEIKHRLTLRLAASMCDYVLTGNAETDDRMISMQMAGEKYRIVTVLRGGEQAIHWYKKIHSLPTLPLFSSNRAAGVPVDGKHPVYFFFTPLGDVYCKAEALSHLDGTIMITEEEFQDVYTRVEQMNKENSYEQ